MDFSWFLLAVSAAIFVSIVLLAVVCLDCRNKGPLVSIRQTNASEEYMPSIEFRVIHTSPNPNPSLLSPGTSSANPGTQGRHQSFTPTETDSNRSYENQEQEPEIADSDPEDAGYIIVLPDGEAPPSTNLSRASTPSSDQHDYENVPESEQRLKRVDTQEDRDYQNVDPQGATSAESDTDDDDEGNYVNQPPMLHSHLSA